MKTSPIHWLDYALWPLLKIFWEPFSTKQSHWWHWKNFHGDIYGNINESYHCSGMAQAKSREGFWPNFWQTNFGWKNILILSPKSFAEYRLGFQSKDRQQICSIILQDDVGVLIGPDDANFFAISLQGFYIPLSTRGIITKKEFRKKFKNSKIKLI